jgi:hypothetical protein
LLSRAPGKSIESERAVPTGQLHVGSEVESWCGKCKEMREHRVVAMVGGEPKQVICQTCQSRHAFKGEPPERARSAAAPRTVAERRALKVEDLEKQKRQEQKRALQKELMDAVDPRPFDPRGRYKAGEIIVHPEHGRGKIENVLKGSLLVRFYEGLRPLDLA